MPFTPPVATSPVIWSDLPSTASALDAANLNAEELGLIGYTQAAIAAYDLYVQTFYANPPATPDLNVISRVGNLSGVYALDLSAAIETVVGTATLTGDTTIAVTGFSAVGTTAEMTFLQDATGGHALSINALAQTNVLTVPVSGAFVLRLTCTDGSLFAEISAASVVPAPATVALWVGTIAALVSGQLDTTIWPYQSVVPGHLTVLTDPLGSQGTVLMMAITETG